MRVRKVSSLTLLTAVVMASPLAACTGDQPADKAPAKTTTTSSPTTAPSSPTASPTTTLTTAPPRSPALLKKALLELSDLPSGFAIEPEASADDDAPRASSKDAKCAPLVMIMNADRAPGSTASAAVSFSAGQDGPFIDETLDALGDERKVQAALDHLQSAITACPELTLTMPGVGSSTMTVQTVKPPASGDNPVAARITATGGSLDGLELVVVTAGVADTLLSMTFLAAFPEDIDGATQAAVDKAQDTLHATPVATS